MVIYEYHLESEDSSNAGMRFEGRGETLAECDEGATNAAADVVCNAITQHWTLSRLERWENPELHDFVDADGEFHFVEVAKFDKAIGIIHTDL